MSRVTVLLLALLALAGCRGLRPSDIPEGEDFVVAVKVVRIPRSKPLIAQAAKHAFVDFKKGSEARWRRIEIFTDGSGVVAEDLGWWEPRQDVRWDRDVEVLRIFTGEEARAIAIGLETAALRYPHDGWYRPWPGPNSNTFQAWLTREVPGYAFEFDHNSVGKDWAGAFFSGRTTSGTGYRIDTPVLGLAVALEEGVELHLLQLTFGVSLLRPALKLPGLPRIGFPLR